MTDAQAITAILAELQRARRKFPDQRLPWGSDLVEAGEGLEAGARDSLRGAVTYSAILAEEVGEVLGALPHTRREELIQVAAMAIRALVECTDLDGEPVPEGARVCYGDDLIGSLCGTMGHHALTLDVDRVTCPSCWARVGGGRCPSLDEARVEGQRARRDGVPLGACPYEGRYGYRVILAWRAGWGEG